MSKGLVITFITLGIVSCLPIWRGAGHSRHDGVSFWTLLHDSSNLEEGSPFGHPHLPYSEACRRAHQAWLEHVKEMAEVKE